MKKHLNAADPYFSLSPFHTHKAESYKEPINTFNRQRLTTQNNQFHSFPQQWSDCRYFDFHHGVQSI